jgi:hypothetical protein
MNRNNILLGQAVLVAMGVALILLLTGALIIHNWPR